MKVTVVIPNYNGKHFLKNCLDSLRRQSFKDFVTLVIDNASSDGSVDYIKDYYPEVKTHIMDKNYGYSGAVNYGIKASATPFVLLLNNDTEVHPYFIEKLYDCITSCDDIFSVSSKMIQYHNRKLMDDAGDLYNIIGWPFQRGVAQSVKKYRRSIDVFSACAGASIYRRKMFEQIGYFDEIHFAYLEDIDVGYRALIQGYRNIYCPLAICYHIGSGTSGSKYNSFKVKLAARNSVYLNYKNMPPLQLFINALPLATGYILKTRFFKKIGFGKEYLEGLREGFRTRKKCNRVLFDKKNLRNYIHIELMLIKNMFIYVYEYTTRKL